MYFVPPRRFLILGKPPVGLFSGKLNKITVGQWQTWQIRSLDFGLKNFPATEFHDNTVLIVCSTHDKPESPTFRLTTLQIEGKKAH